MKERLIKFRIFHYGEFHYWGFVCEEEHLSFIGVPFTPGEFSIEGMQEKSEPLLYFDKNGSEVYEGDIIERKISPGWCREERYRGVVVRGTSSGKYFLHAFEHHWITKDKEKRGGLDDMDLILDPHYKHQDSVVGNIHQTPELLKDAMDSGWKQLRRDDQ